MPGADASAQPVLVLIMLRQIYSVSSLIFATIFLLLGNGMFMSLLALRGRYEGFGDHVLGIMSSIYFIGFLLGGYIVPRIVRRMGHIRAFAFFASSLAVFVLLHSLIIDIHFWMVIRLLTGISIVGFYTVIESWFNGATQPGSRAQLFAVYMMAEMFSNALAQQMLRLAPVENFTLFAIAAIMVCLSVMPVTATRLPQPVVNNMSHLTVRRMWKAAPIGVFGALAAGMTNGTLWTMGALYGKKMGLDTAHVAILMSTIIIGGAVLQLPLGRLSDFIDRRKALAVAVCGGMIAAVGMMLLENYYRPMLVAAFLYGGMVFCIYSIALAHLMDHLEPQDMMAGSAGFLLLYGVGAIIGPAVAGTLMDRLGALAFPAFFAIVLMLLFCFIWLTMRRKKQDEIVAEQAQFIPMIRTAAPSVEITVAIEEHRLESTGDSTVDNMAADNTTENAAEDAAVADAADSDQPPQPDDSATMTITAADEHTAAAAGDTNNAGEITADHAPGTPDTAPDAERSSPQDEETTKPK